MPISSSTPRVPIESIWINREKRQRRVVDTADLEDSIRQHGLIQPVVITKIKGPEGQAYKLMAGERRLTALRNIGETSIPVTFLESLDPVAQMIIELEENVKRHDLVWQDQVRAITEIHTLYKSTNPAWTQTDTANSLGFTQAAISKYFRLLDSLSDERVMSAATMPEAISIIKRRDERAKTEALAELFDLGDVNDTSGFEHVLAEAGHVPAPTKSIPIITSTPVAPVEPKTWSRPPAAIINQDFLKWAPTYSGPKFNFIHCDFPYGINFGKGAQANPAEPNPYEDTPEAYWTLLNCLLTNWNSLANPLGGHLMFWYSNRQEIEARTRELLSAIPHFRFSLFPLIWVKSDQSGVAADFRRDPRHIYETCLFGSWLNKGINVVRSDAYSAPPDRELHSSTKPEPMLKHFMSMFVDQSTVLLDPTCGSGSSIRAAEALGSNFALGLELDPLLCKAAQGKLFLSRNLRAATTSGPIERAAEAGILPTIALSSSTPMTAEDLDL